MPTAATKTPEMYATLGRMVAEARSAKGLSQADLARRSGLNREAVTLVESGDRKLAVHELAAMAKVFGRQWAYDVVRKSYELA